MKRYDQAYFDKWYRGRQRVNAPAEVRRKVALAVAQAEYFLQTPLRDVLDVGCGEAAWRSHLRALRPGVEYLGVDASDYVVRRFGRSRNIRKASFGQLGALNIGGHFDLVVCSDALHYVPEGELRRGLPELVRLAGGILFLEVLTAEDDIVGDVEGLIRRSATWYRTLFRKHGLVQVGAYTWAAPGVAERVSELERL